VMIIIGLTGWMGIARLVRGEVLRVRNMEYVTAANSLGFGSSRTIFRHVLPNSLAPVLVSVAFGVAGAILTESALSFLGLGVPLETVTWGSTLNLSRGAPFAWWLAVFPGLMIFLTVVSYNLIGDGLRDATDPRLKV
jgi:peptide/nickel transport system permease protein